MVRCAELSDDFLRASFQDGSGLAVKDGTIELPKVPMNRSAHYKVLAALDRADVHTGKPGQFDDPIVLGGIKGGVGGGKIQETKSRTGTPKRTIGLVAFLVLLVVAQLVVFLRSTDSVPLDCATGKLTLVGSTAFEPVLREAAGSYADTCHGASFAYDIRGSGEGLRALNQAKNSGILAFSDGEKPAGYPGLLPRPIAFFLFTLVANADAGVQDLTADQVRAIYAGHVANWKEIGGRDVPVRLVSRNPGSGTRTTFQRRLLNGVRERGSNSDDCQTRDPGAASARDDLSLVRIGGHRATLDEADHGAYPFWETEYGYTYTEPDAHSLAASFLRYLTNQVGADILRSHGNRPCAELANPALCRPS